MRSFLQSLVTLLSLGMLPLGCSKSETPPPAPTDVTFYVPAMN